MLYSLTFEAVPTIARHTFNKLIVLWTILLLWTPCTTKQSLKDYLGIPVAAWSSTDRPDKLRNCPESRQAGDLQASIEFVKKQIKDQHLNHPYSFITADKGSASVLTVLRPLAQRAYPVPIYILHDQLLI